MIKKVEVYLVECDACGEKMDGFDSGGWSVHDTIDDAQEHMDNGEWETIDGEVFCPGCAENRDKP